MGFAKRLDRSRDHGTMHPPYRGAYFSQDGFYFDHDGTIVDELLKPEQKKELAERAAAKATASTPVAGKKGAKPPAAPAPVVNADDDADVNLEAWLKGEEDYIEAKVKKIVRARFQKQCNVTADLVLFLVKDLGVIPVGELADKFKPYLA